MAKFPVLRSVIVEKLLESFLTIQSAKSHRAALWILGEYCEDSTEIQVKIQFPPCNEPFRQIMEFFY
jgi:coatomer subunit beta